MVETQETSDVPSFEDIPVGKKRKAPKVTFRAKKRKITKKEEALNLENLNYYMRFNILAENYLSSIKYTDEHCTQFEEWFGQFKTYLSKLPASKQYELEDLSWTKKSKVVYPLKYLPTSEKGFFKFLAPTNVTCVGSYPLKLSTQYTPVDIILETPEEMWHKHDYLNLAYYKKKALYLTYLAIKLRKSQLVENLKFDFKRGHHLNPILIAYLKGNSRLAVSISVIPPQALFKLSRFIPERNNIRPSWFYGKDKPEGADLEEDIPTPYVNQVFLRDFHVYQITEFLSQQIRPELFDGLYLLKYWLVLKDLDMGHGNFSGFLMTVVTSYLAMKDKFPDPLTTYKMISIVLTFLSDSDWIENGISLNPDPIEEEFKKQFDVVIMDPYNRFNLASDLTLAKARVVQHEAKLALDILNSNRNDMLDRLVKPAFSRYQKYDHVFHIKPSQLQRYVKKCNLESQVLNHTGLVHSAVKSHIEKLLTKALDNNLLVLNTWSWKSTQWDITKEAPKPNLSLTFCLLLNSIESPLIKGPEGDTPEAKQFVEFWGEKSEMRQFKDSSILECVSWPGSNFAEKRDIPRNIVNYILEYQGDIQKVEYVGNQMEKVLHQTVALPKGWPQYGTGEEVGQRCVHAFSELSNNLRNLGDFAQYITSMQGIGAYTSMTEVFPQIPCWYKTHTKLTTIKVNSLIPKPNIKIFPRCIEPLEVGITIKGDKVWQGITTLDQLRTRKTRYYLQITKVLKEKFNLTAQAHPEFIDILKDGFIFRLFIINSLEREMLKTVGHNNVEAKASEKQEALLLELTQLHLPTLRSMINGLHYKNNCFGPATRIAVRWLASTGWSDYFPDIAVEILTSSLFLDPCPYSEPHSPQVAFIRFLSLLANKDWANEFVITDFNNEISQEQISTVKYTIENARVTLPAMVLVTPQDPTGCLWTKKLPTLFVLHKVVELASTHLKMLESSLNNPDTFDIDSIIAPNFKECNILIKLRSNIITKRPFNKPEKPFEIKPYHHSSSEKIPVVSFDIIKTFISTLQNAYEDNAYFLYDKFGGDTIGVVMKKNAFEPVPISTGKLFARKRENSRSSELCLDYKLMQHDIKNLGKNLIESFKVLVE